MRWSSPRTPDIFNVVKKYQLYDRILQRNVALAKGYGLPASYYRSSALTPEGLIPSQNVTRCYCWNAPIEGGSTATPTLGQQPDRSHFLCSGLGVLNVDDTGIDIDNGTGGGYSKYGYKENIFSEP